MFVLSHGRQSERIFWGVLDKKTHCLGNQRIEKIQHVMYERVYEVNTSEVVRSFVDDETARVEKSRQTKITRDFARAQSRPFIGARHEVPAARHLEGVNRQNVGRTTTARKKRMVRRIRAKSIRYYITFGGCII